MMVKKILRARHSSTHESLLRSHRCLDSTSISSTLEYVIHEHINSFSYILFSVTRLLVIPPTQIPKKCNAASPVDILLRFANRRLCAVMPYICPPNRLAQICFSPIDMYNWKKLFPFAHRSVAVPVVLFSIRYFFIVSHCESPCQRS